MDGDNNYTWMYGTSFTGLLVGVENCETFTSNEASGSQNVGVSYPTHSVAEMASDGVPNNNQLDDRIYIDEFGVDHKDDIDDSSKDEDVDEVHDPAARMAIDAAAITPTWNVFEEPNTAFFNSWNAWDVAIPHHSQEELAAGQIFNSLSELKRKVIIYSASRGKEFRVKKQEHDRWTIVCMQVGKGCQWRLSARRVTGSENMWRICKYHVFHAPTCVRDVMHTDNRNVTEKFICGEIIPIIREDTTLKPRAIMQIIQQQLHVRITYRRAWGGKQIALATIFGDWDESYAILTRFLYAVQEKNPGTIVEWKTTLRDDGNGYIFQRVFWSFGPSIHGFKQCRPLITIDGTHLYAKYKGCLLIAMGVDANNQIFPLAFAIVESENGSSWCWFMNILGNKVTQRTGLCVISDRQPGIMKAMNDLPRWREPNAFHKLCVRHLVSNFHVNFKDKNLRDLVSSTAYIHEEVEFERRMQAIGLSVPLARKYLEDAGREKWSLSHDNGHRYGVMTTNMSECFNGVMKGARPLPITGLVQATFFKLNTYFVNRLSMATKRASDGHPFSEKMEKKLAESMEIARCAQVTTYNFREKLFEVNVPRVEQYGTRVSYLVDLTNMKCTCQRWRNLKVPCPHVLGVCMDKGLDYGMLVDHFYSTEAHMGTYEMSYYPVLGIEDWPEIPGPSLVPDPTMLRDPGRPGKRRSTRYKNEMDINSAFGKNFCGACGKKGHNIRSCASRASSSGQ